MKPANLSKLINYADTHRSKLRSLGRWVAVGSDALVLAIPVVGELVACVG